MEGNFYLVLPSNSSMLFYPDNATSCYTTHLAREIKLNGDWSVGLAEIHVPCTIMDVQESESIFNYISTGSEQTSLHIPYGIYETVPHLVEEINRVKEMSEHHVLEPTASRRGFYSVRRVCECKEPHALIFSDKVRRILGFESEEQKFMDLVKTTPEDPIAIGSKPASTARAVPSQLFLYTDVCNSSLVGDTQSSLLRIINVDFSKYKFGSYAVKHFAPIHYIPLLHRSFQTISIDIRDEHGEKPAFEGQTLTVTLHFKRNR